MAKSGKDAGADGANSPGRYKKVTAEVGWFDFFFFELISQVKCILFVVLLWQGLVKLK